MKTLCPRCGSETLDLGMIAKEFRSKKIQVDYRICPKCKLIFCESV